MPAPRRVRFTMGQMLWAVAFAAAYMGFFASIRQPGFILILLSLAAGYWLILVLPFYLIEKLAERRGLARVRRTSSADQTGGDD